jgi:hypothetical protein
VAYASLVVVLTVLMACGSSQPDSGKAPATGAALEQASRVGVSTDPVPVGEEWVLQVAYLHNITSSRIHIRSISLSGSGLGSVVELVGMRLAPLPANGRGYAFTPAGVFKTYPPVWRFGEKEPCHVQRLVPVRGAVLGPDEEARVMDLVKAVAPGNFSITGHRVAYSVKGGSYVQVVPVGQDGVVAPSAGRLKLFPNEQSCIQKSRMLPSGR